MTVSIEPIRIEDDGPTLYILVRQVGRHKDIEQMPDGIRSEREAVAYAAQRWKVREGDVVVRGVQVIDLEE